jgi:protein-tyrosine-phosphatase/predicted ATP-grasp superfamily ATP-dependent carboligase
MNIEHTKTHRILILDADLGSALTILRSLDAQGLSCDIASSSDKPICKYSRYAKQFYIYPNPLVETENFVDAVCQLVQKNNYDLVIPVTERSLIPLSKSNKLDPWRQRLAIADSNSLLQVLDKSKTLALAQTCVIPVPFSHTVTNLSELEALASQLDYPVVVKPGHSIPDAKMRRQLSVCYAHSASELNKLGKELLVYCSLLVQQYVLGEGTGIELLANHGEVVYAFQHKRLHELPLTGGGSCYRKSVSINPVLLAASQKLIKALNWHGVAMVEFKWQSETGEYWLMEINGRFWGSLPLAVSAGADFPAMLFNLLINQELPKSKSYREEIYCCKLSADIQWYEQVLRKNSDNRLVKYPSKKKLITDLLFILHPTRHYFDIQCWYDPIPGIVDVYRLGLEYILRMSDLLYMQKLNYLHQTKWVKNKLHNRLKSASTILFLCYGNINRSTLAHALAEKLYSKTNIEFDSAGFHPLANRGADPNMIEIAAEHSVDLSNFSSKTINASLLKKADVIFVMERQQYDHIKKIYPESLNKTFLLGSLSSNKNLDIPDPYNQTIATYRSCYLTINEAVGNLL